MNHIIYFLGFVFLRDAIKPWFPVFRDTQLLLEWALTSGALILIVLAVRWLLRNRLSARLRYALWGVVLLRLLVPFQVQLPAPVSDSLPLVASNLAPEPPASWDERDVPLFSAGEQPIEEMGSEYQSFQPGYLGPGPWSDGCIGLSEDGKTVTPYADIFTRNEVLQSVWWVGVLAMAAVLLVSNLRFFMRLEERRKRLEVRDVPVRVYVAEGLPSPCLFGVFKPAVYVTPEAADDSDTLRHVLAHELTHYKHKDHLWSLLRCLALALHWYNPLVWLAMVLSKRDGELACDEGAVARLGEEERIPYGRTLVDMVAKRSLRPADLLSCSTAMTGGGKSVQQRVAQLVKKPETVRAALFAAIAVVALSVVFVFAGRAQADGTPRDFQGYLDMTTGIHYYPSLYSSTLYPDPITDPELLSQAKEVLSGVAYLSHDDPQPDLDSSKLLGASRISLPNGVQENKYTLLWQNDRTYLLPGDPWTDLMELQEINGETAQLVSVSGTLVSKPGVNVASVLERLAREQSRMYVDPKPMTPAELADWNRLLLREQKVQLQGRPHNRGTVEFHAGYTSETKGTVDLWYWGDATHDGVWVLSLEATGPDSPYTILNDQPIVVYNAARDPEERPAYEVLSPEAFAAALRPRDVETVYRASAENGYMLWEGGFSLTEMKGQLTQAMYHQFTDTYSEEKYGQYSLVIRVAGEPGQRYTGIGLYDELSLTLSVGQAENKVCLFHGNYGYDREMSGRAYVYSPEVYETILSLHEQVPDMGDLTAEQVAQINETFRSDVRMPDGSWGPSEISCFFTSSYDDPTQIDLEEFLAYCPIGITGCLGEKDVEEFQAVIAKDGSWDDWEYGLDSPGDLPVPTHRYPREKVSALLQKYAGVTVNELDWSGCLYVEEYDAFYNFTSDYGPGFFHCEGGEISGDTARLWSAPDGNGDRCELVLRKSGDRWLIQSHHTTYER